MLTFAQSALDEAQPQPQDQPPTRLVGRGLPFFLALVDRVIVMGIGVLYVLIATRTLTTKTFGVLVIVDTARLILANSSDAFVSQPLIKYAAEADRLDSDLAGAAVFWRVFTLLVIWVGLWLLAPWVALLLREPELQELLTFLPFVIVAFSFNSFSNSIRVAQRLLYRLVLNDLILLGVFTITMVVTWQRGLLNTPRSFMAILASSFGISGVFGLISIWSRLPTHLTLKKASIIRLGRYGLHSLSNSFGNLIWSKADITLLAYYLSPLSVGLYNAAFQFTNIFIVVDEALNTLLFPRVSRYCLQPIGSQQELIRGAFEKSVAVGMVLLTPACLVLFLFAEPILAQVFTPDYAQAGLVLRLVAVAGLIHPFIRLAGSILNGVSRPDLLARITWTVGACSVALNVILIPRFGISGAALVALIANLLTMAISSVVLHKIFRITGRGIVLAGRAQIQQGLVYLVSRFNARRKATGHS